MKIENLDTAIRYKERLDELRKLKELIESHPTTGRVKFLGGLQNDAPYAIIKDDCLNGIICKYCEDTIKLIEEAVERL